MHVYENPFSNEQFTIRKIISLTSRQNGAYFSCARGVSAMLHENVQISWH